MSCLSQRKGKIKIRTISVVPVSKVGKGNSPGAGTAEANRRKTK